jgi:hypothetical protein
MYDTPLPRRRAEAQQHHQARRPQRRSVGVGPRGGTPGTYYPQI